ncbi:hypothetical protein BDR06DRAFT_349638 [Suillus hirtellus]|nr:hypothetical protein BDR06DRAFT_349638 [Suillus hirtellus]
MYMCQLAVPSRNVLTEWSAGRRRFVEDPSWYFFNVWCFEVCLYFCCISRVTRIGSAGSTVSLLYIIDMVFRSMSIFLVASLLKPSNYPPMLTPSGKQRTSSNQFGRSLMLDAEIQIQRESVQPPKHQPKYYVGAPAKHDHRSKASNEIQSSDIHAYTDYNRS